MIFAVDYQADSCLTEPYIDDQVQIEEIWNIVEALLKRGEFEKEPWEVKKKIFDTKCENFRCKTVPYQVAAGEWEKLQFHSYHPWSAATSLSDGSG